MPFEKEILTALADPKALRILRDSQATVAKVAAAFTIDEIPRRLED